MHEGFSFSLDKQNEEIQSSTAATEQIAASINEVARMSSHISEKQLNLLTMLRKVKRN